jgi:hypothetical protein
MRTTLSFYVYILSVLVIAGCASSNKSMKQLPEAQVRPSEQQSAPVNEELTLIAIQSKYLLKDTTQTKVYLYVDAFKGKNPISVPDFVKIYNLNYVIYSDYGTRDRLGYGNVKLDSSNVSRIGDKIVIAYDIEKPKQRLRSAFERNQSDRNIEKSFE